MQKTFFGESLLSKRIYHVIHELGIDLFDAMSAIQESYKSHFASIEEKDIPILKKKLQEAGVLTFPDLKEEIKESISISASSKDKVKKISRKISLEENCKKTVKKDITPKKVRKETTFKKSEVLKKNRFKNESKRKKDRKVKGYNQNQDEESYDIEIERGLESVRKTLHGAMYSSGKSASQRRVKRQRKAHKKNRKKRIYKNTPKPTSISIDFPTNIKKISQISGIKVNNMVVSFMNKGDMISQSQQLTKDQVSFISQHFDIEIHLKQQKTVEENIQNIETSKRNRSKRCPVVTVMGHVDHGKTSLLGKIRQKSLKNEAGGITQNIGAYSVHHNDEPITFIDTPGHQAFTAMRSRGAKITDIVVLVVAADDSVRPQTLEAISHAKDAGVEIVVAINKIDKSNSDPEQVKQDLSEHGLRPVAWGGSTEYIETSAITGQGIEELLQTILDVSEILELKAASEGKSFGYILDSKIDKKKGILTTILPFGGKLNKGDVIFSGDSYCKVRRMTNSHGHSLSFVAPGHPVEVSGFSTLPLPGGKFFVCSLEEAKKAIEDRNYRSKIDQNKSISLNEDVFAKKGKTLSFIIRCGSKGVSEVIKSSLVDLSNSEIKIDVQQCLVGEVSENDLFLASVKKSFVIAFNTQIQSSALIKSKNDNIPIYEFDVIYSLIDFVKEKMENNLDDIIEYISVGKSIIRKVFKSSKLGVIAGCYVDEGFLKKGNIAKVYRDKKIIFEGKINSLKRFEKTVSEVKVNYECGCVLENFSDFKEGDIIECIETKITKRKLSDVDPL